MSWHVAAAMAHGSGLYLQEDVKGCELSTAYGPQRRC